ncbi:hypothetical protein [Emticicia fontis]
MKILLTSILLVLVSIMVAEAQLASDSPAPMPAAHAKARVTSSTTTHKLSSDAPIGIPKDSVAKAQVPKVSQASKLPSEVALSNKKD